MTPLLQTTTTTTTTPTSYSTTIRASTTFGAASPFSFSTGGMEDDTSGGTTHDHDDDDAAPSYGTTTIMFTVGASSSSSLPRGVSPPATTTPLRRVSMASSSTATTTTTEVISSVTASVATTKDDDDSTSMVIVERTAKDVLMGRGKGVDQWPGNVYYRKVVSHYREAYKDSTQNAEKVKIAATIVRAIQEEAGGRFIEQQKKGGGSSNKNNGGGCWSVVPYARAKEKVHQSLRDSRKAPKKTATAVSMVAAAARCRKKTIASPHHASFLSVGAFGLLSIEPPTPPPSPPPPPPPPPPPVTTPGAIVQRTDQDVLIGRFKKGSGNGYFRQLVENHQEAYTSLIGVSRVGPKKEQQAIVDKIIQAIHDTGGRFLQQQPTSAVSTAGGQSQHPSDRRHGSNNDGRTWIVATYDRAVDKVVRALREQRAKSSNSNSAARLHEDECKCQSLDDDDDDDDDDTAWEPLPLLPKDKPQPQQQPQHRFIPIQPFAV